MPIAKTSDGFYVTMGGDSIGPFQNERAAAQAELLLAAQRSEAGRPPTSPQFPIARLGPQAVPMRITPAVLPAGQRSIADRGIDIGPAQIEQVGAAVDPWAVTIGDAVIEPRPQARSGPSAGRLLPKKTGKAKY